MCEYVGEVNLSGLALLVSSDLVQWLVKLESPSHGLVFVYI